MTRLAALLFCSSLIIPAVCQANPWLRPEGEIFAALTSVYYSTDEYITPAGDTVDQPTFTKYELNPYVEYGLTDDWTVGASLFLHALEQESPGGDLDNYGLGQTELFVRHSLWKEGRIAASVEPFLALPASYEESGQPRAGREDSDLGLALNGGYGFPLFGREHFVQGRAAYKHRYGPQDDQFQLDAKLGLRVAEGWMIMPEAQWTLPTGDTSGGGFSNAGTNDYELLKLQLSAVYDVSETTSLQVGAFTHADGENTGAGGGGLLSLWRRF